MKFSLRSNTICFIILSPIHIFLHTIAEEYIDNMHGSSVSRTLTFPRSFHFFFACIKMVFVLLFVRHHLSSFFYLFPLFCVCLPLEPAIASQSLIEGGTVQHLPCDMCQMGCCGEFAMYFFFRIKCIFFCCSVKSATQAYTRHKLCNLLVISTMQFCVYFALPLTTNESLGMLVF